MSLLIKALEQAAKDRKAGRVEPVETPVSEVTEGAAPAAPLEPTLEPPPPPRVPPGAHAAGRPERAPAPPPASEPPAAARAQAASERAAPARRAATSLTDLQQIDAQQQRARAAAVMQAGGGAASQALAFLRANPVVMIGALAVLVGLVFGVYVYLQIAKPGLFARQVATRPQPVQSVEPQPAPPVEPTAPPAAEPAPPIATPAATASSGTVGGPTPATPAPAAPPPAQVLSSAVIATTQPATDMPRALPAERESRATRGSARERPTARSESAPAPAATAAAAAATEPAGRERISVSPSTAQPRLNPTLNQAYAMLQGGNLEEARALYTKLSQAEPLNIDALLGLAYIAAQENRSEDATKLYLRILQLNPRHAVAQAALIGLMGRADPAASESRLKQLIAREPSAFLHFVLGNLYSDQQQWAQAQQSYFQAHHLEPDNPDYAYNLAVGLDQLRQPKLALNFYRRAEQLASARGQSNFNLSHARERIRALTSQLE